MNEEILEDLISLNATSPWLVQFGGSAHGAEEDLIATDVTEQTPAPEESESESDAATDGQGNMSATEAVSELSACIDEDTSMLQDFLGRVRARKAAKEAQEAQSNSQSPTVSSTAARHPLGHINSHSPPQGKSRSPESRREDPQDENSTDRQEPDATGQDAEDTVTFRRSKRTRNSIGGSSSTTRGAHDGPSLIPVRRIPGFAETVVLEPSEAQKVAIITRVNTRRNKGQPCTLVLKKLSAHPVDPSSLGPTVANTNTSLSGVVIASSATIASSSSSTTSSASATSTKKQKSVRWDQQLTYFQDGSGKTSKKQKKKGTGKTRRTRSSDAARVDDAITATIADDRVQGADRNVNGTPAPKRRRLTLES
ncbi:MAG: hypothetical protein M1838_003226 [Thelocarpon superellum]|nr:MAG: hypothetical protein M1838_003226 [Thelocarpon superellum]